MYCCVLFIWLIFLNQTSYNKPVGFVKQFLQAEGSSWNPSNSIETDQNWNDTARRSTTKLRLTAVTMKQKHLNYTTADSSHSQHNSTQST